MDLNLKECDPYDWFCAPESQIIKTLFQSVFNHTKRPVLRTFTNISEAFHCIILKRYENVTFECFSQCLKYHKTTKHFIITARYESLVNH